MEDKSSTISETRQLSFQTSYNVTYRAEFEAYLIKIWPIFSQQINSYNVECYLHTEKKEISILFQTRHSETLDIKKARNLVEFIAAGREVHDAIKSVQVEIDDSGSENVFITDTESEFESELEEKSMVVEERLPESEEEEWKAEEIKVSETEGQDVEPKVAVEKCSVEEQVTTPIERIEETTREKSIDGQEASMEPEKEIEATVEIPEEYKSKVQTVDEPEASMEPEKEIEGTVGEVEEDKNTTQSSEEEIDEEEDEEESMGDLSDADEVEEEPPSFHSLHTKNETISLPVVKPPIQELTSDCDIQLLGKVLNLRTDSLMVVIESNEDMQPLDEGSVLATSSRKVLGCVDETFGPISRPLYVLRYTDISEIPENFKVGDNVYYAANMVKYVIPDAIRTKGTDASNFYDEELETNEQEYSDDEAEKSAKMKKKRKNTRVPLEEGECVDETAIPTEKRNIRRQVSNRGGRMHQHQRIGASRPHYHQRHTPSHMSMPTMPYQQPMYPPSYQYMNQPPMMPYPAYGQQQQQYGYMPRPHYPSQETLYHPNTYGMESLHVSSYSQQYPQNTNSVYTKQSTSSYPQSYPQQYPQQTAAQQPTTHQYPHQTAQHPTHQQQYAQQTVQHPAQLLTPPRYSQNYTQHPTQQPISQSQSQPPQQYHYGSYQLQQSYPQYSTNNSTNHRNQ